MALNRSSSKPFSGLSIALPLDEISRLAGESTIAASISRMVAGQVGIEDRLARTIRDLNVAPMGTSALQKAALPWLDGFMDSVADQSLLAGPIAEMTRIAADQVTAQVGAISRANFMALSLEQLGGVQTDFLGELSRTVVAHAGITRFDTSGIRLAALKLGYDQRLGGSADAFGRLDAAVRGFRPLTVAVDDLITATRTRGALGFDQRGVEGALGRVDEVLADPAVERTVLEPFEEVQELAGIEEDVIHLPDVLGLVRRARGFRLSTRGIFCGFTVGSLYFVAHAASGAPLVSAGMEAFVVGADIYVVTRSRPADAGK